jgi:hypothetical protein
MKQLISFCALFLFPILIFAQGKNIDGKWQLTSFNNNTSNLSVENNEYCFWCQLNDPNNLVYISKGKLKANLNGEDLLFDVEVKDKEIVLKKNQLVEIELNGEKLPNQNVKSFTNYSFIRGGKSLTLTNQNSPTKEVYTFKLIK